jgi:hypothetical protein
MPIMTILVGTGALLSIFHAITRTAPGLRGVCLLLAVVLVCVVVIGTGRAPYTETRYSFHLYPIALLLAIYGYGRTGTHFLRQRSNLSALPFIGFLCLFLAGDDFRPRHLWTIDSYETNFRVHYSPSVARHYYARYDFRSVAEFVNESMKSGDIVITTDVVTSNYLTQTDFVFLSSTDRRYGGRLCPDGITERWSNAPLVASQEALQVIVNAESGHAVWLIVDTVKGDRYADTKFVSDVPGLDQKYITPDGKFIVYSTADNSID